MRTLGRAILSIPFVLMFLCVVAARGYLFALFVTSVVGLIAGCVALGFYLIDKSEGKNGDNK